MVIKKPRYTHYSYLSGSGIDTFMREPTGLYDLSLQGKSQRRAFIQKTLQNGELLAAIPYAEISNMKGLQDALSVIADLKRNRPKWIPKPLNYRRPGPTGPRW